MNFLFPHRFGLRLGLVFLLLGGVFWCAGLSAVNAADSPAEAAPAPDPVKETERLRKEIERLQETNRQLQLENQQMRKMIGELFDPILPNAIVTPTGPVITNAPAAAKSSEVKTNDAKPMPTRPATAVTHWQSFSGKRHNATCRYFKYPGGNPCGPTDGVACRLCGG